MNNFDLELKQIQLQNEKLFRELSALSQVTNCMSGRMTESTF